MLFHGMKYFRKCIRWLNTKYLFRKQEFRVIWKLVKKCVCMVLANHLNTLSITWYCYGIFHQHSSVFLSLTQGPCLFGLFSPCVSVTSRSICPYIRYLWIPFYCVEPHSFTVQLRRTQRPLGRVELLS